MGQASLPGLPGRGKFNKGRAEMKARPWGEVCVVTRPPLRPSCCLDQGHDFHLEQALRSPHPSTKGSKGAGRQRVLLVALC